MIQCSIDDQSMIKQLPHGDMRMITLRACGWPCPPVRLAGNEQSEPGCMHLDQAHRDTFVVMHSCTFQACDNLKEQACPNKVFAKAVLTVARAARVSQNRPELLTSQHHIPV